MRFMGLIEKTTNGVLRRYRVVESHELAAVKCIQCGAWVKDPNPKRVFCSSPCRMAHWHDHNRRKAS